MSVGAKSRPFSALIQLRGTPNTRKDDLGLIAKSFADLSLTYIMLPLKLETLRTSSRLFMRQLESKSSYATIRPCLTFEDILSGGNCSTSASRMPNWLYSAPDILHQNHSRPGSTRKILFCMRARVTILSKTMPFTISSTIYRNASDQLQNWTQANFKRQWIQRKNFLILTDFHQMLGDAMIPAPPKKLPESSGGLPEDGRERNGYFNIELRTSLIQKGIEALQGQDLNMAVQRILTNLHRLMLPYKCPKPWCKYFTPGFSNSKDRKEHINRHELLFRCASKGCFGFRLGFDAQSKLEQHRKNYHAEPDDGVEFPTVAPKKDTNIWATAA